MVNLINGSCQLVSENNGLKFSKENKVPTNNLVHGGKIVCVQKW